MRMMMKGWGTPISGLLCDVRLQAAGELYCCYGCVCVGRAEGGEGGEAD